MQRTMKIGFSNNSSVTQLFRDITVLLKKVSTKFNLLIYAFAPFDRRIIVFA